MATHISSKSIPVSGAQPRSVAVPTVSVHPAAPQPLRASSGHIAVVARPPKKPDPEAELEQIMFPPEEEECDDEEIPKEEFVTLGTTPSPAPTPSDFPFSPPSRVVNPMVQNSPFQRESMLDSSPPGAPGSKPSPISPREAFRRRRVRSMSCPEKDPNLLITEA